MIELSNKELFDIEGGVISITIFGVTYFGAKAVAIIAAGGTALLSAAGLGFYLGYK